MEQYLGIPDEDFIRSKVPMTKQEIRILTLVKAQIPVDGGVWDIGAGTGSLSIEAARLCPKGKVWAVERSEQAVALLRVNIANLAAPNVGIVEKEAPDGLDILPDPDRVLIGGSGGHIEDILDAVSRRLKPGGRILINSVTVQTVYRAVEWLRAHEKEFRSEGIQAQISRLSQVRGYDMLRAENPVSILTAIRNT